MPKKRYPNKSKEITIKGITFTVWCDGRSYDPEVETYRAVYSYSIVTPYWRYDDNNIKGSPNKPPDLNLACAAILGMLLTCVTADDKSDSAEIFPQHVREAGENIVNELTELCSSTIE